MDKTADMPLKDPAKNMKECIDELEARHADPEGREDIYKEYRDLKNNYNVMKEHYVFVDKKYLELRKKYDALKEENGELRQGCLEFPKAYDLGFEEGFAKGEQSMKEKMNKICEFWEENSAQNIEVVLGKAVTLREMLSNIDESYNKIIDYETRMKKEIEVGDEVENENGNKYIVIEIDKAGREARMINRRMMCIIGIKHLIKTGKHYPIDEMLRGLEE